MTKMQSVKHSMRSFMMVFASGLLLRFLAIPLQQCFGQFSSNVDRTGPFSVSIYPTCGLMLGGTTVIVNGNNFVDEGLKCNFGDNDVRGRYISSTSVECRSPPKLVPGAVPFTLTHDNERVSNVKDNLTFLYYDDIVVNSVSPSIGMIGTKVTVRGVNFVPSSTFSCKFGEIVVRARYISPSEATCVTPSHTHKKKVQVGASVNGIEFSPSTATFEYIVPPQISSLHPSLGSTLGGTQLIVQGHGFLNTSTVGCSFDGFATLPGSFVSENEVRCLTPASPEPGRVSVEVTVNGLDYTTSGAIFRYIAPPEVSFTHPALGPSSGNTIVLLHGRNFVDTDLLQCRFGKQDVMGRFISTSKIECRTPARKVGLVEVHLTLNGVDFYAIGSTFDYHDPILIKSLSPKSCLSPGGSHIALEGENFVDSADLMCRFGSVIVPAVFYSQSKISCQAPAGLIGEHNVTASNNGVDFSGSFHPFKYFTSPKVVSVSPQQAIASRHSTISVYGSGFVDVIELSCAFGEVRVPAEYISSSEVSCSPPSIISNGFVTVEVSLNFADYTSDGVQFEFIDEPLLYSIRPRRGPVNGRTKLTIRGANFVQRLGVSCHFGEVQVRGFFLSSGKVECEAPPRVSPGKVEVSISVANGIVLNNTASYYYLPLADVSSLTPDRWADDWKGTILVNGIGFYAEDGCPWICSFGESFTAGQFLSSEALTCISPASRLKNSTFRLSYPCSQSSVETAIHVNTIPRLILRSVWPDSAPTAASSPVIVEVLNLSFGDRYICSFGDLLTLGSMLNATHILCECPKGGISRVTKLNVRYADSTHAVSSDEGVPFVFFEPPNVTTISPAVSQTAKGGSILRVLGNGFRNSVYLRCKFNTGIQVKARWLSPQQIECRIPFLKPGLYAIEMSNNAVDFTSNNVMHEILPELELYAVSPRQSGLMGGVAVSVGGSGFHSSLPLSCSFGDTVVAATVVSYREISCQSPAYPRESVQPFKVCNARVCLENGNFTFSESPENGEFPRDIGARRISITNTSSSIVSDSGDMDLFVSGDGFRNSNALACVFISKMMSARSEAEWFSSDRANCKVPRLQPGTYALHIADGMFESANSLDVVVVPTPVITEIWPGAGDVSGGTLITVYGTNFIPSDLYCRFGRKSIKAHEVIGSSLVRCRSVASDRIGPAPFFLSFFGGSLTSSSVQYQYTDSLLIHTISPEVVDQMSPMELRIYGTGFEALFYSQHLTCRIGPSASAAVLLERDFSHLTCRFDSFIETGIFPVHIESNEQLLLRKSDAIQIVGRPEVYRVSPSWILYSDVGKKLVVEGEDFVNTEKLSCLFNGEVHRALWMSSSQVECVAPVPVLGANRLTISNDAIYTSTTSLTFQALEPFDIHSIVPDRGWAGTTVTINGKDFSDGVSPISCAFGSSFANATVLHRNALTCVVPQPSWLDQGSSVPIQLFMNGLLMSPEVSHYFRFVELDCDASFPSIGSTIGGTPVTIQLREENANQVRNCRFGETVVVAITSDSDRLREVICISPASSRTGSVQLSLSANGVDFIPSGFSFTYLEQPSVGGIYPDSGPWTGSTIVTVLGSNFREDMNLACRFGVDGSGAKLVDGNWISSDRFVCETPVLPVASLELFFSVNKVDFVSTGRWYDAAEELELIKLYPESAPVWGGVNVTVLGRNFRVNERLSCHFDSIKVSARLISSNEIMCVAPAQPTSKEAQVTVTNNGYDFYLCPMLFRYHSAIAIHSFFPRSGPLIGSTSVTITGYNFLSGPSSYECLFGNSFTGAIIVSDSIILCDSPPSSKIGRVNLTVAGPGFLATAREEFFTYRPLVEAYDIFPSFGPRDIEQVITIYGSHFSRDTDFCCMIRNSSSPAVFISPTEARCVLNADEEPGLVAVAVSSNCHDFAKNKLQYEITNSIAIEEFKPLLTSDEQGVVIFGFGFWPFQGLGCQFSKKHVVLASFYSHTNVECTTPYKQPATAPFLEVHLLLNGKHVYVVPQEDNATKLISILSVRSAYPIISDTTGGAPVAIQLHAEYADKVRNCRFGETVVVAMTSDSDPLREVICIAPASSRTGRVLLSLSANGVDFIPSGFSFTYVEQPSVRGIYPDSGPWAGSTIVTVLGSNFREDMNLGCRFGVEGAGAKLVDGNWISSDRFVCETPVLPIDDHGLVVVGETPVINDSYLFHVYDSFSLSRVTPGSGSNLGETETSLSGRTFFFSGAFSCRFGDYGIVPATFFHSGRVGCTSPQLPTVYAAFSEVFEEVTLQITANGQNYAPSEVEFTFAPLPLVARVSPQRGKASGGTPVTVTGNYFAPRRNDALCKFGSTTVPAKVKSVSTLLCVSPSSKRRKVTLQVSMNGGFDWSTVGSASFEYYTEARVKKLVPALGLFVGGTPVAVHGANFVNSVLLTCRFGGYDAAEVVWISSTQVNCVSPPVHQPRVVSVQVSNNRLDFSTDLISFEYQGYPQVSSISPSFGHREGGTSVTILGKNFFQTSLCKFGTQTAHVTYINAGKLLCIAPPGPKTTNGSSAVHVRVSNNGLDFSARVPSCGFMYVEAPIIHSISPTFGVLSVGDTLTVHGAHFNSTGDAWCIFSALEYHNLATRSSVRQATSVTASMMKCAIPSQAAEMKTAVHVSVNMAHDRSSTRGVYTFSHAPRIMDLVPRHGSASGGTPIDVIGENFSQDGSFGCLFGQTRVPGSWMSATRVQCISPAVSTSDYRVPVALVKNGSLIQSGIMFHYQSLPTVSNYFSNVVKPGETFVEVTGTNFFYSSQLKCKFGNALVHGKFVSHNEIHCPYSLQNVGQGFLQTTFNERDFISRIDDDTTRFRMNSTVAAPSFSHNVGEPMIVSVMPSIFVPWCSARDIFVANLIKGHTVRKCPKPGAQYLNRNTLAGVEVTNGRLMPSNNGSNPFVRHLKIRSISPSLGPDTGNSTVAIEGNAFIDTSELFCRFGAIVTHANFISESEISCKTPQMPPGNAIVSISVNGLDYFTAGMIFRFYSLIQIDRISPSFGSTRGGTVVEVYSTNPIFVPSATCRFGGSQVPASYNSDNGVLLCLTPEVSVPGEVILTVSLNGYDYHGGATGNPISYSYVPEPQVFSISPNLGWKKGGTEIFLKTNRLYRSSTAELYCVFGEDQFVKAVWFSPRRVKCISPTMRRDRASVSVYITYGVSLTKGLTGGVSFTYIEATLVNRVVPSWGSITGGTFLHVHGENFLNLFDLSCKFSENFTSAEFVNKWYVRCLTPESHTPGKAVSVEVVTQSGSLKTFHSKAVFEYHAHPSISCIEPVYGTIVGGAHVTIHGNGFKRKFASDMYCRFGDFSLPVPATFINEQQLTCISAPAGDNLSINDNVTVSVSLNGYDFINGNGAIFTYVSGVNVLSVDPPLGFLSGGTVLTVRVSKSPIFRKSQQNVECIFEGENETTSSPATVIDDGGLVVCQSPPSSNAVEHTAIVNLRFNGGEKTMTGAPFVYHPQPRVHSFSPLFGTYNGGEDVRVTGEGFVDVEYLGCIFGSIVSPAASWVSSSEILCLAPPMDFAQVTPATLELSVMIGVTINGADYSFNEEKLFSYVQIPTVSYVFPKSISSEGSTICVIHGNFLDNATACRFGSLGKAVPVLDVSENSVTCQPPPITTYSPYYENNAQLYLSFGYQFVDMNVSVFYEPTIDPIKVYTSSLNEKLTHPEVLFVIPTSVSSSGGEWITIYGAHFAPWRGTGCLFGAHGFVEGRVRSTTELYCKTPPQYPGAVSLKVVNGVSNLVSWNSTELSFFPDSSISSLDPNTGSINGGTPVVINGVFHGEADVFRSSPVSVFCRFGSVDVPVFRATTTTIHCLSPQSSNVLNPDTVKVRVSFNSGRSFSRSFAWYTYESDVEVRRLSPSYGVRLGGSYVLVHGANFRNSTTLQCKFGSTASPAIQVNATFFTPTTLSCVSPLVEFAHWAIVEVTNNGVDFSRSGQLFEYHDPIYISHAWPLSGPAPTGGTVVTMRGSGFLNNMELACVFDKATVPAHYFDFDAISCVSPPSQQGAVPLRVIRGHLPNSVIDDDHHSSVQLLPFLYVQSPTLHAIHPSSGKVEGGNMVFVTGENFVNSTSLRCRFGGLIVRATLISNSVLMCPSPPSREPTSVGVSISSNGLDFSEFNPQLLFRYEKRCGKGYVCGPSAASWDNAAPNGTNALPDQNTNFTLCNPGSFQPRAAQPTCIPCPVSYICPDFGLSKPILCPAGFVCDKTGLSYPSQRCPRGYYCAAGTTARSSASLLVTESRNNATNDDTTYNVRLLQGTEFVSGNAPLSHGDATAVVPIPCPVGYYCRDGVSSLTHIPGNFSTPQKCFDGFFCPVGSFTPEGAGPCKEGYYCPTPIVALECPQGHYCPGAGNVKPIQCNPGTYGPVVGQIKCALCERGHICPGSGRESPELCPSGYVCDTVGLSNPFKLCPSGFYCELGTATSNPDDHESKGPRPCPAAAFCLGGVAHGRTIDWLPHIEDGRKAPQKCLEGYYCGSGSPSPKGTGPCLPGHYCPPESFHPIEVPVGTFSGSYGSIAPSLCFPGTYAPIKSSVSCRLCPAGFTCNSYGTFVPRICEPGTYRSMADDITCLPCPSGTFAPFSGASDVSDCLPCPKGRVCGFGGMYNVSDSEPCAEGYLCGFQTDMDAQFSHRSAAGYSSSKGNMPESQFSSSCTLGFICSRGTSEDRISHSLCPANHFCPGASSRDSSRATSCPRLTVSLSGNFELRSCQIELIDVCDKIKEKPSIRFEDVSYYPLYSANNIGNYETIASQSASQQSNNDTLGEIMVLEKVIPVKLESSDYLWRNDTVEVIRGCPSYGFLRDEQWLTIVGRNFRNSTALTCRFTVCPMGDVRTTTPCSSDAVVERNGIFLSTSRVRCQLPKLPLVEGSITGSKTNLCGTDPDGTTFYLQRCTEDEFLSGECDQLQDHYTWAFRKVYSLLIPCTSQSIADNKCENIPEVGMHINPCFSGQVLVEISNNGDLFSGDALFVPPSVGLEGASLHETFSPYVVPGTFAVFTYLDPKFFSPVHGKSTNDASSVLPKGVFEAVEMDISSCHYTLNSEEGKRAREAGWFELPFMQMARMSFDWRQIPEDIQYDEHFKLAIYAIPSRCDDSSCNSRRVREPDSETFPCVKPIELPKWLTDRNVDKRQIINVTITALDDLLFKAEVHIMHGLFIASADYFIDSMTVNIGGPSRAQQKTDLEVLLGSPKSERRRLSPFVSHDEREVEKEYFFGIRYSSDDAASVSPPLNMPPRWKQLEKGRVLVSMNATYGSIPTVKDHYDDMAVTSFFWENPFYSPKIAKETTDAYFETFHGVFREPSGEYGYNLDQIILPYLPFFSNCHEYDSFITFWALVEDSKCALPEVSRDYEPGWWRRDYLPLPHRDDIRPIGPFDFAEFYPIADWCERLLRCTYEENLGQVDATPRWFEAGTDVSLFSFVRDPIDYYQFTGRKGGRPGPDDGGGAKYLQSISSPDAFIPVRIDRDSALEIEGGCHELCFPRKMTLEVLYYQVAHHKKRLIEASLRMDDFDKNNTRDDYELQVSFRPLDYQELIVKFVYSYDIFVLLFSLIGLFTVLMASLYWLVVRLTTRLESPPKLRFLRMAYLIVPDAFFGFFMGLLPIAIVTTMVSLALKGYIQAAPLVIPGAGNWSLFNSSPFHYADVEVDSKMISVGQRGRMGLAFLSMAAVFIHEGSKLFVPYDVSRLEKAVQQREIQSTNEFIWTPLTWKRANFVYSSFCMGILLLVVVEWSFWEDFGTYIWEAIIGLKILGLLAGDVVDAQVSEALLSAPIMMALGLVQGIVTLSSDDFIDFLLSYVVGLGFLLLERMYINPFQSAFLDWCSETLTEAATLAWRAVVSGLSFFSSPDGNQVTPIHRVTDNYDAMANADEGNAVEPIIEMYSGYCCDTLSLLCTPCIIFILMAFRRETGMAELYGIKEHDMQHYAIFSLVIIPFQIVADIFIHGSLELFHGWRVYDYVLYANYRFRERETKWSGLCRNSLDECIQEELRTMDYLCYSSQYYMMLFVHVSGIIYFILGMEMIIRAKYNPFGDPALPLLIPSVVLVSIFVKSSLIWIALKVNIWKPRSSSVKWHGDNRIAEAEFEPPNCPDVRAESTATFSIEKRMMEDSFRFRFLDFNRNWLISQLPSILTPRTLRRSRPYLVNQFAKILTSLNDDISSDSEEDDNGPTFQVADGIFCGPSRKMMKFWLQRAQRRVKMRNIVEPLITRERGNYCEQCLSRKLLQVQALVDFDEMENNFMKDHPGNEFIQVLWKRHWEKHQKYQTLCLSCISLEKARGRKSRPTGDALIDLKETSSVGTEGNRVAASKAMIKLNGVSKQIMNKWHDMAKDNLFREQGGATSNASISSESENAVVPPIVKVSASSKGIAINWLNTARAKLDWDHERKGKNEESLRTF